MDLFFVLLKLLNVESYFENRVKKKISINKLKKKITCLCSWQIEKLVGKIDIFVNFISFSQAVKLPSIVIVRVHFIVAALVTEKLYQ